MSRLVGSALRLSLAGLLLALLAGQLLVIPRVGEALLRAYPSAAPVQVPLTAVVEVVLVCMQVALVCTWILLGLVERERIFIAGAAVRWVDIIVGASSLATLLVSGAIWLSVDLEPDLPALTAALAAAALVGLGFTLLTVVMRALLRQAAQLRAEMAEVI